MLEAFHVREEEAIRVREADLRESVTALLEKVGVPPEDAALGADVLVYADLHGVDSHGVSNMLQEYLEGYADGSINAHPDWRVVRERASAATIDCDRGLGIIIAPKAMAMAMAKARQTGVGMVTLGKGRHVGAAGYHAMLAVREDMIGVCVSAATPRVPPTHGREGRFGTNPIAVAAPAGEEHPFLLDIATSTVAINKFRNAKRLGAKLPPGMVGAMDGTPIMERVEVPEEYLPLPLGSTREMGSHKGYGLAAVVEILSSILSGSGFTARNGPFQHMVAAYDVDAFVDLGTFKADMDDFIRTLRNTPPAAGHERVLVPGQPEVEAAAERSEHGIPLHHDVVEWLRSTCAEMEAPCAF